MHFILWFLNSRNTKNHFSCCVIPCTPIFHSLVSSEDHGEDEVLLEMLNGLNLLVGRLTNLDQAEKEEEAAATNGGGGVTLGPSDRFRLREVCYDNVTLCSDPIVLSPDDTATLFV